MTADPRQAAVRRQAQGQHREDTTDHIRAGRELAFIEPTVLVVAVTIGAIAGFLAENLQCPERPNRGPGQPAAHGARLHAQHPSRLGRALVLQAAQDKRFPVGQLAVWPVAAGRMMPGSASECQEMHKPLWPVGQLAVWPVVADR